MCMCICVMAIILHSNHSVLPAADVATYLGLFIDKLLTWNPQTRLERQETNRQLHHLLDSYLNRLQTAKYLKFYYKVCMNLRT